MNGVSHYNTTSFQQFFSEKGTVSWKGVFVSMTVSLFIVAGFSLTLNIISQNLSKGYVPDKSHSESLGLAQLFSVRQADAATITTTTNSPASAVRLIQSVSTLSLGKKATSTITIGFKNTGTTSWPMQGMSLRSSATKGSYLSHDSWQSTIIITNTINAAKPGELVYVKFIIEAPVSTGTYQDTLYLTHNGQKLMGTDTSLKVTVSTAKPDTQISSKALPQVAAVSSVVNNPAAPVISGTFDAIKLIASGTSLTLGQLQTTDFQIGWKNTGTATWKADDALPIRVRSTGRIESYFHNSSWDTGVWVMTLKKDVQPGEVVFTPFKLEAPTTVGNYTETFSLYRGNTPLGVARVVLPIQVIKGTPKVQIAQDVVAPLPVSAPTTATTTTGQEGTTTSAVTAIVDAITESEPVIRVGVFNTRDVIKVTANKAFEVRDGAGAVLATLQAGSIANVSFDFGQKIYTVTTDTATTTTTSYVRLVGVGHSQTGMQTADIVFDIVSYVDHPGWSSILNDNRFRTAIEVRYSESKDRLWVINELGLEHYLKGLAETSNKSHIEFQKSLVIAARTYAKIVMRTPKYTTEYFHVRNTDADQVYRGYSSEIRMPQFGGAVEQTRGVMVTYNGAPVVTPYYSNSDGRTRSWEEVWAGSAKPWLKSVPDPYCAGLKLWGHGVGMSARGAVGMAINGSTFQQILNHYYTGIQLMRIY